MKFLWLRFTIFVLMSFCLFCVPSYKPVFNQFEVMPNVTYFYYTSQKNIDFKNATIIDCGSAYIVKCDILDAKNVKNNLDNVLGESVRISVFSIDESQSIISKYQSRILYKENIDDYCIYYCYDSSLPKFVSINGQKINIQIAVKQNTIDIGYPLILNGF